MLLINNGKIMTMKDRQVYEDGFVILNDLIESGPILALGEGRGLDEFAALCLEHQVSEDDKIIIDAQKGYVMPGLIDSHCHIGLWEDGQRSNTGDGNEMTDPVTPHLRAIDAVNPLDKCFNE